MNIWSDLLHREKIQEIFDNKELEYIGNKSISKYREAKKFPQNDQHKKGEKLETFIFLVGYELVHKGGDVDNCGYDQQCGFEFFTQV